MLFFLDDTPNTVAYMVAGYAVLLGLPALYVLSWILRRTGLKRELDLLKSMQAERDAAQKAGKPQA
jgi:hypothetical protein